MHLLDREFRYTDKEREWLEDKFDMPCLDLIRTQVLPVNDNGIPTGGGTIRAQVSFLWMGLRHYSGLTEAKVREYMRQIVTEQGMTFLVLNKAVSACFSSGALGFVWTPPVKDESEDEGKGSPAATADTPADDAEAPTA